MGRVITAVPFESEKAKWELFCFVLSTAGTPTPTSLCLSLSPQHTPHPLATIKPTTQQNHRSWGKKPQRLRWSNPQVHIPPTPRSPHTHQPHGDQVTASTLDHNGVYSVELVRWHFQVAGCTRQMLAGEGCIQVWRIEVHEGIYMVLQVTRGSEWENSQVTSCLAFIRGEKIRK